MAGPVSLTSTKAKQSLSPEQIVSTFNEMRQQQRILASRITDVELDMKEHDLVIDVLKGVDPNRKCYRMIGGVLVERRVENVLPGLVSNREKMKEFTNTLHKTLEVKGKELNQFRETYGLQIRADVGSEKKEEATSKRSERQPNILAGV